MCAFAFSNEGGVCASKKTIKDKWYSLHLKTNPGVLGNLWINVESALMRMEMPNCFRI